MSETNATSEPTCKPCDCLMCRKVRESVERCALPAEQKLVTDASAAAISLLRQLAQHYVKTNIAHPDAADFRRLVQQMGYVAIAWISFAASPEGVAAIEAEKADAEAKAIAKPATPAAD